MQEGGVYEEDDFVSLNSGAQESIVNRIQNQRKPVEEENRKVVKKNKKGKKTVIESVKLHEI